MSEKALYGFLAHYVALLAVFAAAAVGSVHPWPQMVVVYGGLFSFFIALLAARSRHASVSVPALFLFFVLLFLVMLLQVIPLPLSVVEWFNPHLAEIRSRLGHTSSPLAYDAPATLFEAFKVAGYAGFLFSAYQVTRHGMYTQRMVQVLAFAGTLLAALALLHNFAGFSRMYGLYRPETSSTYFLPFVNENHASGYYGFIFFVMLSLGMGETNPRLRFFTLGCSFLPFLAVIWTGSRAGIAALAAGIAIWWFLAQLARDTAPKLTWILLAFIGLLVSIPLMDFYVVPFLNSPTGLDEDVKIHMWQNAFPLISDHLWTGVGRGGFSSVYPYYYQLSGRISADYIESLPLQFIIDYGVVVASAFLVAGSVVLVRYFRRIRLRIWKAGLIAAVATLLLQNLFDFNLEFPGTALSLVVVLGVLSAQRYHGKRRRMRKWIFGWTALGVPWTAAFVSALVAIPLWVLPHRLEVERERVSELGSQGKWAEMASTARDAQQRHPADYYLAATRGLAETFVQGGQPLRWIGLATWLFPRHYYPELMAARVLSRWKKSSQAAMQYGRALRKGAPLSWRLLTEIRPHVKSPVEFLEIVPPASWNRLVDLVPKEERPELCLAIMKQARIGDTCSAALTTVALARQDWPLLEQLAIHDSARSPQSLRPVVLRLRSLHGMGRTAELEKLLAQAIGQFPRHGVMCSASMMQICRTEGRDAAFQWARKKIQSRTITPGNSLVLLEMMLRLVPPNSPEAIAAQNQIQTLRRGGRTPADRDLFLLLDFLWDPASCKPVP
ncbi:O-antigen ligase family protein [Myxococcota bacterium]|nr:O-antigen ligase family protein [Myxococcota bacterium]MBU1410314.1 O-antigen ligase family protein [Myxococcota bacterium]MBU1509784.1 O-antigen ligase family protein [Myxococcota bacterium]